MTLAAWNCAALVACVTVLAVDRAEIDANHRPLAALLAVWMIDPLRTADGSALAAAWALALPVLSAAVAGLVWARSVVAAVACAGLVILHGDDFLHASIMSIVAQAMVTPGIAGRTLTLADRCMLVLLAGDVAGLGGPLGDRCSWAMRAERWWIVQWQGALVAAVLVALHLHAGRPRA